MIIDLDLMNIFVHVPKTGGTSFGRLYNMHRGLKNLPSIPETNCMPLYHTGRGPQIGFVHHTISHLIQNLGSEFVDSFKIHSMVRNPWHWAFSRYIWFIENPKMFSKAFRHEELDQLALREKLRAYRNFGFKHWLIKNSSNQWAHEMHIPHPWPGEQSWSQSLWLYHDDELQIDCIHKLEDGLVNIDKRVYSLPPHNQRAQLIPDYVKKFNEAMDDDCISFIEDTCKWEIDNFGYMFERMKI